MKAITFEFLFCLSILLLPSLCNFFSSSTLTYFLLLHYWGWFIRQQQSLTGWFCHLAHLQSLPALLLVSLLWVSVALRPALSFISLCGLGFKKKSYCVCLFVVCLSCCSQLWFCPPSSTDRLFDSSLSVSPSVLFFFFSKNSLFRIQNALKFLCQHMRKQMFAPAYYCLH